MSRPKDEYNPAKAIAETMGAMRARHIRELRARIPTPSYEAIAFEVGCSVKTVYNVLTDKTHVAVPAGK